jgi:putative nucleotidyltransferase with HDIG domain
MEIICDVLRRDPVLTANIIRASNAATEGVDHLVGTVEEAVFRLGFNTVHRKALALCARSMLKTPDFPSFKSNQLWAHALSTAIGTRMIAQLAGLDSENAYTAGLLHDIGKLVISMRIEPRQYEMLFSLAKAQQRPLVEVEREYLGIDHSTLAQQLLEYWKTPPAICEGIQDHHQPVSPFGAAVQIADILTYEFEQGFGGNNRPTDIHEARETLGIAESELEKTRIAIRDEVTAETKRLSTSK